MIEPKNYVRKMFLLILIMFSVDLVRSLNIENTKISVSRNQNRANICNYYSASYSLDQREKSKAKIKQYAYLSDVEIEAILSSKSYSMNSPYTVLLTLPHIISLATLFVLVGPLFCCCVWPEKHPLCKNWRKPQKEMYTKCQLKWTAYLSLILYMVVCIGGLIALIEAPMIIKKYNDFGCKNAAVFDDMLYGRVSKSVDGRFFVGLEPFRGELATFNSAKISTFFSDSSNSLSSANQARMKQGVVQTTIQTTYSGYINSVYSDAFSSDGSTYFDVSSAFKTMHYGPPSDDTKMLGIIKSKLTVIFNEVNSALDAMIAAWDTLQTKTEPTVKLEISSFDSSADDFKLKLQSYLNEIGRFFNKNQLYDQLYALLNVYYGMIFAFALLGALANILIAFYTVVRTRLIMYFTCGFLVFLAALGFFFLTFLAFIHPQMTQICVYADKRLPYGNQTKIILQKMGYPHFGEKVLECMLNGSGKMVDTINPSFSSSFDMINVIAKGTLRFNEKISSFAQSNLDQPFTTVQTTLSKIKNAQVWDIQDSVAINHVSKIFSKNYPLDVSCNSVRISGDVWMPSFSLFSCPAGKSKMPVCNNLALQTICPLGCYQILNQFVSPSGDPSYITSLATRYGGTSCNYYQYITKLHNWNIARQTKMNTVNGSINSIKVLVDDYAAKVSSVKAALNSFKTTLQTNLNSMTNLTSGSFYGLDCRTIGESIWQLRDSYCIGLVSSVRYNIICLCLICYGVLLLACCVTCTGVRHFKHLEKMQMHTGSQGNPISLSDTIILQK